MGNTNPKSSKNKTETKNSKPSNPESESSKPTASIRTEGSEYVLSVKEHLDKFDELEKTEKTAKPMGSMKDTKLTLNIGGKEEIISADCAVKFMEDPETVINDLQKDKCPEFIKDYWNKDTKTIKFDELLHLSNDFKKDSDFINNLYNFIIVITKHIDATNEKKSHQVLLMNLRGLIKSGIDNIAAFMKTYNIIDDHLIKKSYNLLYLLHAFSFQQANIDQKKMKDVHEMYEQLTKTITENLGIYNKIIESKETYTQQAIPMPENIKQTADRLKKRLDILKKQHTNLQSTAKSLEKSQVSLKDHVDKDILKLEKTLHEKVVSKH